MQAGQSTDSTTTWRGSFATYVPPDFDLFDFDNDAAAPGVVRDLCAWHGHHNYPAQEVALSWVCGSRKVLVATGLSQETQVHPSREGVMRLAMSQGWLNAVREPVTGEVAGQVAADDTLWRPWVVPMDFGSLQRCEYAQLGDAMVGYGYRDDRIVLIAAVGGSGAHWALRTVTGERAMEYVTDPYAQVQRL